MTRTHIRHVDFRKWFPRGDKVAACLARLFILREDLYIEFQGLNKEKIKLLDGNSTEWRRTYFTRNIFKTLAEINSAIVTLNRQTEFKEALKSWPTISREKYLKLMTELRKAQPQIKELRNRLGGHVSQDAINKALDSLYLDSRGLMERGPSIQKIHYQFTTELVLAVMLFDAPEKSRLDEMQKIINILIVICQ